MEKVKRYFKTYPKSDACFETSDGMLFHRHSDASAHAATLKDKKVTPYNRQTVDNLERTIKLKSEKEAKEKEAAAAEAKAQAEKKAKENAEAEAKAQAEKDAKEKAEADAKSKEESKSKPAKADKK